MNRNGEGAPGLAPRPKYHASHGTTVEMHGTPAQQRAFARLARQLALEPAAPGQSFEFENEIERMLGSGWEGEVYAIIERTTAKWGARRR